MRLAKEVARMVPFPTWPRLHTHAHTLFCTESWYGLLHDLCVRLCNFATAVKLSLASGKNRIMNNDMTELYQSCEA